MWVWKPDLSEAKYEQVMWNIQVLDIVLLECGLLTLKSYVICLLVYLLLRK